MTQPLRIAVAGLGTVGAALLSELHEHGDRLAERCGRPVEVVAVSARDRSRDRGVPLDGLEWCDDPQALAASDCDVVIELLGGEDEPALGVVRAAIANGRHVVTANKALLAKHGVALAREAEGAGVALLYEAAVAGGIPVVKTMREALAGNATTRVFGILNGTCNYILTRMEADGLSFADCLAEAQRLGYAEADPTFDVEGNDTAHKLAILASLAFGTEVAPDAVYLEGITGVGLPDIEAAGDLGYRIKLLGVALRTDTGVEARVHPALVPLGSAIAETGGVTNAVVVETPMLGALMMSGPGAGGAATASAVLGDIADLARGGGAGPVFGRPAARLAPHERAAMREHEGGYLLRMDVTDRPGVMAAVATRMAEAGISLESIVQRRTRPRGEVDPHHDVQPIVLVTHETTEEAVRGAVDAIRVESYLAAEPSVIRIERLT